MVDTIFRDFAELESALHQCHQRRDASWRWLAAGESGASALIDACIGPAWRRTSAMPLAAARALPTIPASARLAAIKRDNKTGWSNASLAIPRFHVDLDSLFDADQAHS